MKKKASKVDLGGSDGLTHNPFASLRRSSPEQPAGQPGDPCGEALGAQSSDPGAPVVRVPDGVPDGPLGGEVVIRHERKGHGGKTVTIATWRGGPRAPVGAALETLARDLGRRLGSRARVAEASIVVQGDLVERLAAILEQDHGVRVTRGTS